MEGCYNRDGTKQEHWSLPGGMHRGAVICPRFIFFTAPLHVDLEFIYKRRLSLDSISPPVLFLLGKDVFS